MRDDDDVDVVYVVVDVSDKEEAHQREHQEGGQEAQV
jgi:hypothetical protein